MAGKNKTKTMKARDYIKENIEGQKRNEILNYLLNECSLKLTTLETLYKEAKAEEELEIRNRAREKKKQEEREIKFKGKRRNFFYFDDTKLYKDIKK
ncbi:hypothetical protein [Clostridium tertium]|uniref:hypothetical protein n=1 Tax=Clostridium tertium TaxID=1559 RepID=UPI00356AA6DC